jgi:hypothetical protein
MDLASTVTVHIDSPEAVDLEVQRGNEWAKVCTSPCDQALSTKDNYRINGSGIRTSKAFRIRDTGTVKLDVEPASSTGHTIAIVLVITGGVGFVPGLGVTGALVGAVLFGLILICPLVDAFSDETTYGECLGDIAVEVGKLYAAPWVWIPAIGGLALVVGGGAWLASSSGTQVRPTPGKGGPATPPGTPGPTPAGTSPTMTLRREPGHRELGSTLGLPPAVAMPLIHVQF